jgi:hypothetical protein
MKMRPIITWKRIVLTAGALVGGTLLALAVPARAQAPAAGFEEANRAYAEGHYAAAAQGFESLVRTRGWSAPLLYDLANSYAQEGRVGLAVVNYERARMLAPRDADIAANLAHVRARAGLPTPPSPWYRTTVAFLSPAGWTWFAIVALWLGAASFFVVRKWHQRRLIQAGVLALVMGMTALAALDISEQNLHRAVVVQSRSAPVRVSPFDSATSESSLSEGDQVAVLGQHGNFVHVRDSRGHTGWVQSSTVQTIIPRNS